MLISEVNEPVDEQTRYFGDGEELHMLFDYTLNAGVMLGLACQ